MRAVLILSFAALLTFNGCIVYYPSADNLTKVSDSNSGEVGDFKHFQVVHAELCHKNGLEIHLKSLEMLSLGDVIQVEDDGYLILLHASGEMFEYVGRNEISIGHLARRISTTNKVPIEDFSWVLNAEYLFNESAPNRALTPRGTVARSRDFSLEVLLPEIFELSPVNPSVCVRWIDGSERSTPYIIRIKNIYDEVLDEFEIVNQEIFVDFSNYYYDPQIYIISIRDNKDEQFGLEIGVKVRSMSRYIPSGCDLKYPCEALEMAFFIEGIGLGEFAEPYYKLAADLSNRGIYQELLRKYHLRSSRN